MVDGEEPEEQYVYSYLEYANVTRHISLIVSEIEEHVFKAVGVTLCRMWF